MEKFYINDIPEETTVAKYLQQKTDFHKKIYEIRPRKNYPKVIVLDSLNLNLENLEKSILEALSLYGDYGWRTREGILRDYTGFSLVYNPRHQDGLPVHASTLGTPQNSSNEFFWDVTKHHQKLKNSYFDAYGFNVRTPAAKHGALGEFLDRSQRTLIRSRVSVLHGNMHKPEYRATSGWHRDEIIFENLRINIPIVTSPNYLFQMEDEAPVHLAASLGYTWNTNIPHRVFSDHPSDDIRTHIVLGFSPWFDYLLEERAWIKNEFFGKLHPFDILAEGYVFPGITIRDDIIVYR